MNDLAGPVDMLLSTGARLGEIFATERDDFEHAAHPRQLPHAWTRDTRFEGTCSRDLRYAVPVIDAGDHTDVLERLNV